MSKILTLWGLIIIAVITAIFAVGITNVSTEVASKYTLSNDSYELLSNVNPVMQAYNRDVAKELNSSNINPDAEADLNGVSEFFQEFKTFQTRYDQTKNIAKTVYGLPDWFLFVIPFVEAKDLGFFIQIYRALVWITMIIIFIKVLRSGVTD